MAWIVIALAIVGIFFLVTFLLQRSRKRSGKVNKLNVRRERSGYATDRTILGYHWTMGGFHDGGGSDVGGDVGGDGGGGDAGGGFD